jgi:hypothetical protein
MAFRKLEHSIPQAAFLKRFVGAAEWNSRLKLRAAEWNSTAESEKAPQGLVWDRSPRKGKTLRVLETLRV